VDAVGTLVGLSVISLGLILGGLAVLLWRAVEPAVEVPVQSAIAWWRSRRAQRAASRKSTRWHA
jgi:hypothetical protein